MRTAELQTITIHLMTSKKMLFLVGGGGGEWEWHETTQTEHEIILFCICMNGIAF